MFPDGKMIVPKFELSKLKEQPFGVRQILDRFVTAFAGNCKPFQKVCNLIHFSQKEVLLTTPK